MGFIISRYWSKSIIRGPFGPRNSSTLCAIIAAAYAAYSARISASYALILACKSSTIVAIIAAISCYLAAHIGAMIAADYALITLLYAHISCAYMQHIAAAYVAHVQHYMRH